MIKVPYLSKEEIERDAELLLVEYEQSKGLIVGPLIPIEDIVEKYLKLGVEFDDMHRICGVPRPSGRAADILGAMYFDERRIVIDESLDPEENPSIEARYRFTLAHEGGGHWRLHRHFFARNSAQSALFEEAAPSFVCRSSDDAAPVEWQANYYAACLLMPRGIVLAAWRQQFGSTRPFVFDPTLHAGLAAGRRYGLRPISNIASRDHQPACDRVFDDFAKAFAPTFGVSVQAMRFRLVALGLLLREAPIAGLG